MQANGRSNQVGTAAHDGADDAVGVTRYWFVAVVARNTEKNCRERLRQAGYDVYVASQEEVHIWANGRRKKVERILIPARVFICLTETERREVVALPYIKYFLTDKAAKANAYGVHPVARIPDREMQMLRFMLYQADAPVDFVSHVHLGDRIRVVRGSLKGFEGHITNLPSGKSFVVARLDSLGCAIMKISPEDVEILKS